MELETIDNTDSPRHIIFKKNSDGFREIDKMPAPDFTALIKNPEDNKERGVVIIGVIGHIGHTSARILETLNTHPDFQGNVVIVSEANNIPSQIDLSMAGFTEQIHQSLVLEIKSMREDIQDIILEKDTKPYHNKHTQNFYKHQKPQVHNKSFKTPIRKTQRKK